MVPREHDRRSDTIRNRKGRGHVAVETQALVREISKFEHDARNQLNLVLGYLDLLQREPAGALNPAQQAYVEQIRSAALTQLPRHLARWCLVLAFPAGTSPMISSRDCRYRVNSD